MSDDVQAVDDCDDWEVVEDGHNFIGMSVTVDTSHGEQSGVIAAIWEFPGQPRARRRRAGRSRRSVQLLHVGHRIRSTLGLVLLREGREAAKQHARLRQNNCLRENDPQGLTAHHHCPCGLLVSLVATKLSVSLSDNAALLAGAETRRTSFERQVQTQSPDSGTRVASRACVGLLSVVDNNATRENNRRTGHASFRPRGSAPVASGAGSDPRKPHVAIHKPAAHDERLTGGASA